MSTYSFNIVLDVFVDDGAEEDDDFDHDEARYEVESDISNMLSMVHGHVNDEVIERNS